MNVRDPEKELAELHIQIRRTDCGANGPEARCDCPFCPRRPEDVKAGSPSFAVNLRSGAWHCHRCDKRGSMFMLREQLRGPAGPRAVATGKGAPPAPKILEASLVARMEAALWGPEGDLALRYLRGARGFTDATIKHFRLGFSARKSGPAVAIPHFMGGLCVGVKYRLLSDAAPHKYDREAGCRMPLFGIDSLKGYEKAIVTEGEFDAITLAQMFGLDTPVCSLTEGATAGLKDEARVALTDFEDILLCTDMDAAGDEAAAKLAATLGTFRCRRVRLPKKDANECMTAGVSADVVQSALREAASCHMTRVRHVSEWRGEMQALSAEFARGASTGWPSLDALMGGLRGGEVTLLTAATGSGKTSWTIDLVRRQGMQGTPCMLASLEMRSIGVAAKLMSVIAGCRWDRMSPQQREPHLEAMCALPIYLLDKYGSISMTDFRTEVEFSVRRHGVRVVVLDHLHFALGVAKRGEDERGLIDAAAFEVQQIALDFGVHVVLVMHPAKIRSDETGRTREPEIADLKGSSGPSQFADQVMRISRHEGGLAGLKLLKARSELAMLGGVALKFDAQTLRFEEAPPGAPPTNGFKPAPAWRRGPND